MINFARASAISSLIIVASGCANVTPPPNRISWDNVDPNTFCTSDESAVNGQFIGSLVLSGIGGWDIGTGIALGQFPILGIGLAAAGIMGGSDVDTKKRQIKECNEFKQYVLIKKSPASVIEAKDTSIESRLTKLESMLKNKTITKSEYDKARIKVLNDL